MICDLCGEDVPRSAEAYPSPSHRECMLREVSGGIGHHIAHNYWCVQMHDPNAGLTYRQSALLTDLYVRLVGVDVAVGRWPT